MKLFLPVQQMDLEKRHEAASLLGLMREGSFCPAMFGWKPTFGFGLLPART